MKKEKKFVRKSLSIVVAIAMLTGGIGMMASMNKEMILQAEAGVPPPSENVTTLRVYGECYAIYPTHSYNGTKDFIYPNAIDVFDPGVISKDSLTFNPALIYMLYHGEPIRVGGGDASEKVFLRLFYEPCYHHGVDDKMDACSSSVLYSVEPFDAIVTETTYVLTTKDACRPLAGAPPGELTHFVLPYSYTDPDTPGMDTADILYLAWANYSEKVTNGTIDVEKTYSGILPGTQINFMDHNITYIAKQGNDKISVEVKYVGNMYEAHSDPQTPIYLNEGEKIYFDRANHGINYTDACHRWYVKVLSVPDGPSEAIDIVIGRRLVAGETFYVNGVRYDMPAIYVKNTSLDPGMDEFKFITFQSPIPKCPSSAEMWYGDLDKNVDDWSHVTSQWLANLRPNNTMWLLPPFNEEHLMIDDIGLEKINTNITGDVDYEVPSSGLIIDGMKDPLEFWYDKETTEPRFDTSLAERHAYWNSSAENYTYNDTKALNDTVNNSEAWAWWSIYTKPIRYTEFVLPNQETASDTYDEEKSCSVPYNYSFPSHADGYEYLLVSSFIAPNSEEDQRENQSKTRYDAHDIIDKNGEPRVAFEYDAENDTGIYINGAAAPPPTEIMEGDINGDGHVTILDVLMLQAYFADPSGHPLTPDNLTAANTYEIGEAPGTVDMKDVLYIQKWLADPSTPLWDATYDEGITIPPVP